MVIKTNSLSNEERVMKDYEVTQQQGTALGSYWLLGLVSACSRVLLLCVLLSHTDAMQRLQGALT